MESKLLPVKRIVYSSVAILSVAAVLWVLFPKARKVIAAAVIISPIPPIP